MLFSIRAVLTRHAISHLAHQIDQDRVAQAFGVGDDDRCLSRLRRCPERPHRRRARRGAAEGSGRDVMNYGS